MRVVLLEAGGDPRATGRRAARGLRRAGVPPARLGEPGDALGFLRPPLCRRGAASGATASCSREGILYPRAGTLGGCTAHNAMILMAPHDTDWDGIAALTGDRILARRRHAALLPAAGDCRHRPLWRRLARLRHRSDRAWLGRLARQRMRDAAARRCATTIWCGWCSARRAPRSPVGRRPAAQPAHAGLRRGRPERPALRRVAGSRALLHAAVHRPRTSASARASGCSTSPRAIRTGCGSSCTRWRPACCSTSGTAPPASSI